VLFLQQGSKFKDCIRYYDPFVKKGAGENGILNVPAIVLANLCVAYIMTNKNEEAEEIMRSIEKEEEQILHTDSDNHIFHSCIVNLVIGTLYCEKGNFEFGISRISKSLEPYNKKLCPDTWFYTKRCFLALADNLSKHMISIKDATMHDILLFLDAIEEHGKDISAVITQNQQDEINDTNNVAYEARQLKQIFVKLAEY